MGTMTLRIIQLIQSLPPGEQQVVRDFLVRAEVPSSHAETVSSNWEAEEGLSDDDPFFKIMGEIERERQSNLKVRP